MKCLESRVAIVTGGAQGLGCAIARAFCEAGASVMLTDIRPVVEDVAADLRTEGFDADYIIHDIAKASDWEAVVDKVQIIWGKLDCLVNNAGINLIRTIDNATEEEFHEILDINLVGPFRGIKAVSASMRENGGGSIINICSNTTQKLFAEGVIYSPTKAALEILTKNAAIHFARSGYGIRVNAVLPGAHDTELMTGKEGPGEEFVRQLESVIPMGRLGKPNEVGSTCVFLASDMASYINGASVVVDGGAAIV